jgi:hypothetical protein
VIESMLDECCRVPLAQSCFNLLSVTSRLARNAHSKVYMLTVQPNYRNAALQSHPSHVHAVTSVYEKGVTDHTKSDHGGEMWLLLADRHSGGSGVSRKSPKTGDPQIHLLS